MNDKKQSCDTFFFILSSFILASFSDRLVLFPFSFFFSLSPSLSPSLSLAQLTDDPTHVVFVVSLGAQIASHLVQGEPVSE